ncbi:hypothetical protein ABTZ46_30345, partial [Nocardioides sp. NPDC126508]
PHCRPEHIENQAAFIFRGIAKDNFPQGLPKDRAVDRLAYHWGETTTGGSGLFDRELFTLM